MSGKRIFDGVVTHPNGCPRARDDCEALSRVSSDDFESFMCCGETKEANRAVPEDRFRLCIKSTHDHGIDSLVNLDQRDVIDTASVLLGALSSDAQLGASEAPAQ